jgi:hypothetical protein
MIIRKRFFRKHAVTSLCATIFNDGLYHRSSDRPIKA